MIEYLRLAGATLVVLAPGVAIARALGQNGAAATLVCALTALFATLLVVFATGSSLLLALWLLLAIGLVAAPFAFRRGRRARGPSNRLLLGPAWLAVLAGGIVFGWLLWFVLPLPTGDALFHLARMQKLIALDALSLEGVVEFEDGGLHPGYAFPLWHGFLALVAEISGLEPDAVVRREAAVLAPLSFLVVYEAGVSLFRSAWLGAATLAATLGLTALASGSGGAFRSLALPATAGGRQLLVPAAVALVLVYLRAPGRGPLALVAAAGLVLAVVHPSYALYVLLLVGGFAVARALLVPEDVVPLAKAVATFAVAAAVFLIWLFPVVRTTASYTPTNAQLNERRHGFDHYPGQFDVDSPSRFRLAPEMLARAGPVPVAALCLVPLAFFGARRRWGAFVLGGTLALLAVLLVPFVFPRFADAVSLSQARRLAGFVPFAFALAGGAIVLSRLLSYVVLPVSLAAGIALEHAWPGDFGYFLKEGGPTVPVWIAAYGGALALLVAALRRSRLPALARRDGLAAAAAALFVLPIAATTSWHRPEPLQELTPELVAAVDREARPGDVVLSDPETSYWLAAYAPVYLAASAPAHTADTPDNRPEERRRDVARFFAGDVSVARAYGADWILVDGTRHPDVFLDLPVAHVDVRYTLYRFASR